MTRFHDLFVGLIAITVGCLLIAGAIFESPTLMALAKSRRLAESLDKKAARWIIAAVGAASLRAEVERGSIAGESAAPAGGSEKANNASGRKGTCWNRTASS